MRIMITAALGAILALSACDDTTVVSGHPVNNAAAANTVDECPRSDGQPCR